MCTIALNVAPDGTLVIPSDIARQFGLAPHQVVVVEKRNDVILVSPEETADHLLDELDGCLGQERAEAYDFGLKIGGLIDAEFAHMEEDESYRTLQLQIAAEFAQLSDQRPSDQPTTRPPDQGPSDYLTKDQPTT